MKKIICLLLTFSILTNFFGINTVIYAQNQQQYQTTEANIDEKEGIIYYFPYENSEYFVYSEGKQIIAIDTKTNKKIATLTVDEVVDFKIGSIIDANKKSINKNNRSARYSAAFEMYDEWSQESGQYLFKRRLSFTLEESTSLSVVLAIAAHFIGGLGLFLDLAIIIATYVYENSVENIEVEVYQIRNLFCDILVKRKGHYYEILTDDDGNITERKLIRKDSNYNAYWLGTPWDYATCPNACRVLTEGY